MGNRKRRKILIIGEPQSGKSYFMNWLLDYYISNKQGSVCASNVYNTSNFAEFEMCKFSGGTLINQENDFSINKFKESRSKQIRLPPFYDDEQVSDFLRFYKKNLRETHLLIDDCSVLFDKTVGKPVITFCGVADHIGIDFTMLFHHVNYTPKKLFAFATHVVLFSQLGGLDVTRSSINQFGSLLEATNKINNSKPHHFAMVDQKTGKIQYFQPITN